MIKHYGGGWFSHSHPDPDEQQPPAIKHWRQTKRPEEKKTSPGLTHELGDRFAALRRTVDETAKGGELK